MAATLADRNCIVTGASRGLGSAIAEELRRRGANLLLTGKDAGRLETRRRELESIAPPGRQLEICVADLASPAAPERVISHARRIWPRLDALINNAGIQGPIGPLPDNDWSHWQDTIQVNLMAPVALCRLAGPWIAGSGGGSIVNLSGGGATGPRPNFSAYATAKAGLVRFSETLAAELGPAGVRVNCVAPGSLQTDMLRDMLAAGREKAGEAEYDKAIRCDQRGGDPLERAAQLVAFLVSPEAEAITGRLISAVWDPWPRLAAIAPLIRDTDIYTLRRIVPSDRDLSLDDAEPGP